MDVKLKNQTENTSVLLNDKPATELSGALQHRSTMSCRHKNAISWA